MTKAQAIAVLKEIITKIGGGYHCDTQIHEYINVDTGLSPFGRLEVAIMQRRHDEAMKVLGSDAYDIALKLMSNK